MADTVNSVKIELKADAKNAVEGLSKVISAATKLRDTLSRDNGSAQMSREIANAFKTSGSAIDAQIRKIADLKVAMQSMTSLYSKIKSTQSSLAKAEFNADRLIGTEKFEAAKNKVDRLREDLEYFKDEAAELLDAPYTNNNFMEEIIHVREEVKEAEAELRRLQKEEDGSSKTAKSSASSHKSFSTALAKVEKTAKKIKGVLSNIVGGFKNMASSIKGAIPGANKFGGALGKLASQFKRLFVMRILRNAISAMIKGFQEGIQNIAKYSAALNNLDANHANQTMSELASTALYLKNTLGSAAIPVLNAILPIIRAIATAFATAVNYVNQFMSALGGQSSWTRAKQVTVDYASSLGDVGSSAGGAKDAVEDLKRTILGFDEINKLNDANSSSGSGGSGGGGGGSDSVNVEDMFEEVPIDNKVTNWLKELKPYIDAIKDAWGDVKTAVKDLVKSEGFRYLVGTAFQMVLTGIFTALETIATLIGNVKNALNDSEIQGRIWIVKQAWDDVRHAITDLVNSPAWQSVITAVTFVGLTTIAGLLKTISGLLEGVKKGIEKLDENGKIQEFKDAWDKVTKAVADLFNSEGFQDFTGTVLYMAVSALSGILDTIGTIVKEVIIPAFDELSKNGTFEEMAEAWDEIWAAIKQIAENPMVQSVMKGILEQSVLVIKQHIELIAEALQLVASIISGDIPGAIKHLGLFLINLGNVVATSVVAPFETLANAIPQWANSIKNSIPDWMYKLVGYNDTQIAQIKATDLKFGKVTWVEDLQEQMGLAKDMWSNAIDEMSGMKVESEVEVKTKEAEEKYGDFRDEVNGTVMNAPVNAKTTEAKEAARRLREEINKTKATVPVDANTSSANTKANTFRTDVNTTTSTAPVDANTKSAFEQANLFRDDIKKKTTTAPVSAELKNGSELKTNLEGTLGSVVIKGKDGKIQNMKDIWDNFNDYMDDTKILGKDGKVQNMQDMWTNFNKFMDDTHILGADDNIYNRYEIWKNFSDYMDGVKFNAIAYIDPVLTGSVSDFTTGGGGGHYTKFTGGIIGRAMGGLIAAASGTFIDSAQLFMARENGIPEYVGRFGSHSAVANNYQIVTGIAQGVSAAMVSQNDLLREQNSLLREIASKSGNTSVSSILGAMNRVNKRTGTPVVQMG